MVIASVLVLTVFGYLQYQFSTPVEPVLDSAASVTPATEGEN